METTSLAWLLLIPFSLSLVGFASRFLRRFTRQVIEVAHLVSVTVVLGLSLFVVRQVLASGEVWALNHWLYVDDLGAIFLMIVGLVGFLAGEFEVPESAITVVFGVYNVNKQLRIAAPARLPSVIPPRD